MLIKKESLEKALGELILSNQGTVVWSEVKHAIEAQQDASGELIRKTVEEIKKQVRNLPNLGTSLTYDIMASDICKILDSFHPNEEKRLENILVDGEIPLAAERFKIKLDKGKPCQT